MFAKTLVVSSVTYFSSIKGNLRTKEHIMFCIVNGRKSTEWWRQFERSHTGSVPSI
jgi:hypothetical protein